LNQTCHLGDRLKGLIVSRLKENIIEDKLHAKLQTAINGELISGDKTMPLILLVIEGSGNY
jgi:hypothetical protein